MGAVSVPFSNFTDFWDDAPASRSTHVRRDAALLPRREDAANMKTMSIWAEGVEGDVSILVESISGYGCK